MRVVFNSSEEFLQEIKLQAANDECRDRLARLCFNFHGSQKFAGLYYVQLVAGFIGRHGYLYELQAPMGEVIRFHGVPKSAKDEEATEHREKYMDALKSQLAELGFETRDGRFSLAQ